MRKYAVAPLLIKIAGLAFCGIFCETRIMKYKAVIEIPKGCDRRIHMAYDKRGFIDLGPIKDQISVNGGVMPVHYGYLEGVINKVEKDEVDVIVFSSKIYNTGDAFDVEIIGMLTRKDGDHKLIALDGSIEIKDFQDILPEERDLILKYFGYKSKIISVDTKEKALEYLQSCLRETEDSRENN
jgi:inorganic pyrophosphatase